MNENYNSLIFQSLIGLIINLVSTYLYARGLIDLTVIIVSFVGFILFISISGFQSKINEFKIILSNHNTDLKKLNEKLKIYEQLIDLKARVIQLEKGDKNGRRSS